MVRLSQRRFRLLMRVRFRSDNVCFDLLHFATGILCGRIRNYKLYFFEESVILIQVSI